MGYEIGPLASSEVDEADRIVRIAFGTFLGLPDPLTSFGDRDMFRTRWKAGNTRVLAARKDGVLVGSNVITRWGSLGWFGPMSVRPDLWDRGVARALLDETERLLGSWRVSHRGLFTFADSPKHISLYQKYGFLPRYLTFITERALSSSGARRDATPGSSLFSDASPGSRDTVLKEANEVADGALPGLELASEVRSVLDQRLGDTVLLRDGSRLEGFAVCHTGAGTEAGAGNAYVKFGLVRPGSRAREHLSKLLESVESYAISRNATRLEVGVNASHTEAYRLLRERGHRIEFIGVAMQSPDEPGYHRSEVALIDDWR